MTDYGSLLEFQDLIVAGAASRIKEFGSALERQLPAGWTRDRTREEDAQQMGSGDEWLVFNRVATPDLPAASLFFATCASDLTVTNIVPQAVSELSKQQYNAILKEFYESAVAAVADEMALQHELTPETRPLTFWITEAAAEKLRRFSQLANKSTGSAHPLDRNRWFDFIVQVVADQSELDTDTLARWLVAIEHWPEDSARDMILEYEFGRDLLTYARDRGHA
jgi:hypothetical protein